mgnify:CR=1 FL=1
MYVIRLFVFMAACAVVFPVLGQKANYKQAEKFRKIGSEVKSLSVAPKFLKDSDKFWFSYETSEGVQYYFVDPEQFRAMKEDGKVIESRSYNTKCGIWTYFTADDGQIDLSAADYLLIGTLVSYQALREYFGEEAIVPVYLEVEDGLRLARALERERRQEKPKYAEMCRRFLADEEDFSEENLIKSGITERFGNEDFTECLNKIQRYIEEIR